MKMKIIFKKSQLKSLFLIMLLMVMFSAIGYGLTISLNDPDDNDWWTTSSSVDHNFTVVANASESITWCALYNNKTGTYQVDANYTSGILNDTPFVRGLAYSDSDGVSYRWNMTCYNSTNIINSVNFLLGVDSNPPSITLESPDTATYQTSNTTSLVYTPTDASNLKVCDLYHNLSGTWGINKTNTSATNGLTSGNTDTTSIFVNDEQSSITFKWNVVCNDTAGNREWAEDTNRTFTVDSSDIGLHVAISSPANGTVDSDTTPELEWNASTEANFDKYVISVSRNFTSFGEGVIQTKTISTASTVKTNLSALESNDQYHFRITSFDLAGNTANSSTLVWYAVDTTDPSVTLNSPSVNNTNTSDTTPDFNVTVVDNNPNNCSLLLSNSTAGFDSLSINKTKLLVTSGTLFNLTSIMGEGTYLYNIECSDKDNNKVNATTTPFLITIDATSPTIIGVISSWHQINSTDGTPIVAWNQTTDTNFQKYVVEAKYINNGTIEQQINITNVSTLTTEMNLTIGFPNDAGNHIYNFSVTAYDFAGNTVKTLNTTTTWTYIDGTCANLFSGWNICGIVSTISRNLSIIGEETGASFVSVWNTSKTWKTCNTAVGTTNCDINVGISTPNNIQHVWVYMPSDNVWTNRTWNATALSANTTLNNISTNGWNIAAGYFRNGRTFEQLNMSSRFHILNVSMYSHPYNNGTDNIPFITIGGFSTINKETRLEYGEAMWVFFNGSTADSNYTFDTNGW